MNENIDHAKIDRAQWEVIEAGYCVSGGTQQSDLGEAIRVLSENFGYGFTDEEAVALEELVSDHFYKEFDRPEIEEVEVEPVDDYDPDFYKKLAEKYNINLGE